MTTNDVKSVLGVDDSRLAESAPVANLNAVIDAVKTLTTDPVSFDMAIAVIMRIRDSFDKYVLWLKDVKAGDPGRRALIDELYFQKPLVILVNKYAFLSQCCIGVLSKLVFVKSALGRDNDGFGVKLLKDFYIESLSLQNRLSENDFNFIEPDKIGNAVFNAMSL